MARVSELPSADDGATGTSTPTPRAAAGPTVGRDNNLTDVIPATHGGGRGPTPNEHEAGFTFDCAYIELRGCARLGLLLRGTQLSLYCVRSGDEA